MRITFTILTVLLFSTTISFAQTISDSISMKGSLGSYDYYINGKRISLSRAIKIMETNPVAYNQMRSARSSRNLSNVLSFTGAFLVGWELGNMLRGDDVNLIVGSLGAGLVIASFPVATAYSRKAKQALETYNSGLQSAMRRRSQINLAFAGNGVGVVVHF